MFRSPLHDLLPDDVALCAVGPDEPPDPLHPSEADVVARAVPVRVKEFTLGRTCARRALARFGHAEAPIPRGTHGAPIWPDGMAGSITHTRAFFAAAVASRAQYRSLGIDAEEIGRVAPELWPTLFQPDERARLQRLPPDQRELESTLRFSAREAFYKAQSPVSGAWVDFLDVALETGDGWFEVEVLSPIAGFCARGARYRGRWTIHETAVVSAMLLPR